MNPSTIANYRGDVMSSRRGSQRTHLTTVTHQGVEFRCHYTIDGQYLPAAGDEPAEYPVCVVKKIEIDTQDVTRLLGDSRIAEELAERIEANWREEV